MRLFTSPVSEKEDTSHSPLLLISFTLRLLAFRPSPPAFLSLTNDQAGLSGTVRACDEGQAFDSL